MTARDAAPAAFDRGDSPLAVFAPWLAAGWLWVFGLSFYAVTLPNNSPADSPITRLDVTWELPAIYASWFSPDPTGQSGWKFFPQRFDLLATMLFIGAAGVALGRLLLRWLGVFDALRGADRMALAGASGFSALSLVTLAIGLLGGLRPWIMIPTLTLLLAAELACTWRTRSSAQAVSVKEPVGVSPSRKTRGAFMLICTPFVLCMLLGSLLPPTDFDVKEYHLQGPKEYFEAGRIQWLPHNVYTSFPFLTEMLSLTAMATRGDWARGALAGQGVLMLFAPLTAFAVFALARRITGDLAGWCAAAAYLTAPWTYRISIIAYTEGAFCCYVAAAWLGGVVLQERLKETSEAVRQSSRGAALLFGFLAGSAVSTKYPGMVLVAIPMTAVLTWRTIRSTHPERWRCWLLFACGGLAACGPWLLKNLWETGNPFYPLLYDVFGGADWNAELNTKWKRAHGPPFERYWDVVGEIRSVMLQNDWQSAILVGWAPLAWLSAERRRLWGAAAYASVILAAWFLLTHRIDRFWVPVNPVFAVLAGVGLAGMLASIWHRPRRMTKPKRGETIGNTAIGWPRGAALLATPWLIFSLVYQLGFITTGLAGYNAYLRDEQLAWKETTTRSIAVLEQLTWPGNVKFLFVGEAEVFNARVPLVYNTVFDQSLLEEWTAERTAPDRWSFRPAEAIRERFATAGVTHIYINWSEILRYRTTYGYTDFVTPARFGELEAMGLVRRVELPRAEAFRTWESLPDSWRQEIERWGPELKVRVAGLEAIPQFELYEIMPVENAADAPTAGARGDQEGAGR